jgi:hypothetical protein
MPIDPDIDGGWQIVWAALDPTTGAPVSGVTVSGAAITVVIDPDTSPGDLTSGPFMLVPGPES